jgi:hypothetical protein
MVNKYVEHFVDEDYVDDQLTLTSGGFLELTEDLEAIVDKFTGVEGAGFMKCAQIREDLMELIHEIINEEK